MGIPASVYQGCEAIFNDSTVDCAILCLSDDQLVKSGFPIDRFDRLVLVEPETVSEVDQWQKLHDCASFLAELCVGEILLAGDSGGWNQVLDRLPSDRVGWFDSKDLLSGLVTQLSGDIS